MLILTRRPGERLRIAENVVLTVLGVRGNQVRLGIDAPRHIAIDREEVRARKNAPDPDGGHPDGRAAGDDAVG